MIDQKLEKLRELVLYYDWKYKCARHIGKKSAYNELEEAKNNLKEYKEKNYPVTKLLTPAEPFTRLDDLTEQFENYGD
jgi:hypothetical protein